MLTSAGRRLLAFTHAYFAEFDRLAAEVAGGPSLSEEPFRIAAVSGYGRYVLFPVLSELLRSTRDPSVPGLRLDLRFRTAAKVFRFVEEGEVDLGVVYLPKVSNHLVFHPLRDEELVLIAAPAFVRRALRGIDLARLSSYETLPFVTYLEGDYVFGRWFGALFDAQPKRTTSTNNFDELEEVIAVAAAGGGVSVVPYDSAHALVESGEIRVLRPVRGRRRVNQVFAVTRAGAVLRPEAVSVLSALA